MPFPKFQMSKFKIHLCMFCSFLVGGNGYVYEGRGFDMQIYHTNPERADESWQKLDWNGKCLIFAYIAPYGRYI